MSTIADQSWIHATNETTIMIQRNIILHPFLMGLYTVLIPFTINSDQVSPTLILRALILVQIVAAIILVSFQVLIRDWQLTGLICFFTLAITLNYRHFLYVAQKSYVSTWVFRIAFLLLISILLLFVLRRAIWKKISSHININQWLNVFTVILLIFPGFEVAGKSYLFLIDSRKVSEYQRNLQADAIVFPSDNKRDIYYIIVDGYGRGEILADLYAFDNSEFLNYLSENGFYIAGNSRSNYMQTALSLTSSMNMILLDQLASIIGENSNDRGILSRLIQNSYVIDTFRKNGYKLVTFYPGFFYTNLSQADVYYSPFMDINEYEGLFLHNSILKNILIQNESIPVYGYESHRRIIEYSLEHLGGTARIPGPKFVFVHFLAPHPPFIFDHTGEAITSNFDYSMNDGSDFHGTVDEYITGYANQLIYLNKRLQEAIEEILANSPQPPIIILQGDHGPGAYLDWGNSAKTCLLERTAILNAYYMPELPEGVFYPSISPVNSFRILLNHYFQQDLELLPDRISYSTWKSPFQFVDVTNSPNQVKNCGEQGSSSPKDN